MAEQFKSYKKPLSEVKKMQPSAVGTKGSNHFIFLKGSSLDFKKASRSKGSITSDITNLNKKLRSKTFSNMMKKLSRPIFKTKSNMPEMLESNMSRRASHHWPGAESSLLSPVGKTAQGYPIYNIEEKDACRTSKLTPFGQICADRFSRRATEMSFVLFPSTPPQRSSMLKISDAGHSASVDRQMSTSVDMRITWGADLQFSCGTDKMISSYIDKRFSALNERRITNFYGRKKLLTNQEKGSFLTFDSYRPGESLSNASFGEHVITFPVFRSAVYTGKPVKLKNYLDDTTYVDTLHSDAFSELKCDSHLCMSAVKSEVVTPDAERRIEDTITHAMNFLDQFYTSIKKLNSPEHKARAQEVQLSIKKSGTYDLTRYELIFGAKMAWRNAHRCIGRINWAKLQVFDARGCTTPKEMFEVLCQHIRYSTNNGNIRCAMTVFYQHIDKREDYRIWNSYLISYAAYILEDGTLMGDPKNLEFTEECVKLGWQPTFGNFDLLPIVVSVPGHDPAWFPLPEDLVLQVMITHPEFRWFSDLELQWFALPVLGGLKLDCGGLNFTACAFSGWHLGTQVASRCFCDHNRYNIIPLVVSKMSFSKMPLLALDRVVLEVNIAVLYSFLKANVTIIDHHGASNAFLYHLDNEYKVRGGCPAHWPSIVPPLTSSLLGVFHQEMLMYWLKPSFEYQEAAWVGYQWKSPGFSDGSISSDSQKKKQDNSKCMVLSLRLLPETFSSKINCVILFATDTGRSEIFANILRKIFQCAFQVEVLPMSRYYLEILAHESLVLIVTDTYGNGEPPYNGQEFAKSLFEKRGYEIIGNSFLTPVKSYRTYVQLSSIKDRNNLEVKNLFETGDFLQNVRYSIFSLVSEHYRHIGAFGKYLNNIFQELGASIIYPIELGNVHFGLESSFYKWADGVYKTSCEHFSIVNDRIQEVGKITSIEEHRWNPLICRLRPVPSETDRDLCKKLGHIHTKRVKPGILTERTLLQARCSTRQTLLLKINTQNAEELDYAPGDLVGIFPTNSIALVEGVLRKLENTPQPDQVIQVEFLDTECQGEIKKWIPYKKLPPCSLYFALSYFIDLVTPPSQSLLQQLSKLANIGNDKEKLELLAKSMDAYEEWKSTHVPNFLEVLNLFPSLKVPAAMVLAELPILHERYYCISSDPSMQVGELHLTVAVLKYRNSAGNLREGVCSGWMNSSDIGTMMPCVIRKNPNFYLPTNKSLPILMIASGKGIAPFRSFWQHRTIEQEHYTKSAEDEREILGDMFLFFGCKSSALDNIYGKELKNMEKAGILSYYLAFSKELNLPKVYVQDLLKRRSAQVMDIVINKEGHIYVSGDVAKVNEITNALEELLVVDGLMSPDEAAKYIWFLKDTGAFHEIIYGYDVKTSEVNQPMSPIESSSGIASLENLNKAKKCCPCSVL